MSPCTQRHVMDVSRWYRIKKNEVIKIRSNVQDDNDEVEQGEETNKKAEIDRPRKKGKRETEREGV